MVSSAHHTDGASAVRRQSRAVCRRCKCLSRMALPGSFTCKNCMNAWPSVSYGRLTNRLPPNPCTLSPRKAPAILPRAFVSRYFMALHRRCPSAASTEDA
jgi:hypothetical protein